MRNSTATQSKQLEYRRLIDEIREAVRTQVPPHATVAIVSKGDQELLRLEGRQGWHFPQTEDGSYAGHHPADDTAAITHLEDLRAKGADFLLIPSTAFWWLDHYTEFKLHLERRYPLVTEQSQSCLIFALHPSLRERPDQERRGEDIHQHFVSQVRGIVDSLLPDDAIVVVVSKGDQELLRLEGRQGWHFPQTEDGSYAGHHPADDTAAITHLEDLRAKGADFLVVPRTAFSWLSQRPELSRHLDEHYPAVTHQRHVCSIYALHDAPLHLEATAVGWVEQVGWLSDDVLLGISWTPITQGDLTQVSFVLANRSIPLEARSFSLFTHERVDDIPLECRIVTARLLEPAFDYDQPGRLSIGLAEGILELEPGNLAERLVDLRTIARTRLAGLEADQRARVLAFLSAALAEHKETSNVFRLSRNLHRLRAALRERRPAGHGSAGRSRGIHVDAMLRVDERSFYIRGWAWDEERITGLSAVSPEGRHSELLRNIFRFPHLDAKRLQSDPLDEASLNLGFIGFFESLAPSYLTDGWLLEMHNAAGKAVEMVCPLVEHDPTIVRDSILADLKIGLRLDSELLEQHIFPAISRLQARSIEGPEVDSVIVFGEGVERPTISVIVPLFQRIDFLEQQLAQFVHDPELQEADLIYVLDSPELAPRLGDRAEKLFALYRIPFRVVILQRNHGVAAATNIGATYARGRLLVLLDSDVLPDKPGWLSRMSTFYDAQPQIGALGPKLLYEDDSIQHAGLRFSVQGTSGLFRKIHTYKGLHRNLPAANVPRDVPAVTDACLMIDKNVYMRLGGMRGIYVEGDYEDCDLCLRLCEEGYTNWYFPEAELYHLEGQSRPKTRPETGSQYNEWVFAKFWGDRPVIEGIW